jgi:hypothetical protein
MEHFTPTDESRQGHYPCLHGGFPLTLLRFSAYNSDDFLEKSKPRYLGFSVAEGRRAK